MSPNKPTDKDAVIVSFLIENSNKPTHATGIANTSKKISKRWSGKRCKHLETIGILSHKMVKPARQKDKTEYYFIPKTITALSGIVNMLDHNPYLQGVFLRSALCQRWRYNLVQRFDDLLPITTIIQFGDYDADDVVPSVVKVRSTEHQMPVNKHLAHGKVVGRIRPEDDASTVVKKYNLKDYEEYIEERLKLLSSKEYVEKILPVSNIFHHERTGVDLKQEDISFSIIKPHLSEPEKKKLKKCLKTNLLALKFVLYFVSADYKERHRIIALLVSDANNPLLSPPAARAMERFVAMKKIDSHLDIPEADYNRMISEHLDVIAQTPRIDWDEFFNQLDNLNSNYWFLFD